MESQTNAPGSTLAPLDHKWFPGLDLNKCHYCTREPAHEFPVCDNHRHCTQCAKLMTPEEINISVSNNSEPMHPKCAIEFAMRHNKLEDKSTVTIPRVYFDYLNRLRLFVEVEETLSEQTNIDNAVRSINNIVHIDKMSHEAIYLECRKLEAAVGAMHIILGRNADKARNKARDQQQVLSARKNAQEQETAIKEKRIKKAAKAEKTLVKRTPAELKSMSPAERATYKMIQTFMGLGLTESQAQEQVAKLDMVADNTIISTTTVDSNNPQPSV